jgi:hypothetical protein
MDEREPAGRQRDQPTLDRLRAGVILRAYVKGWPAVDLAAVTVEAGPESWASFLKAAAADELAAVLAELNHAAGGVP